MAKKHKHEEHQNLEAWVISYADMVTLLFALFVVLYAIGETKLKKLKKLKKSVQFAFSFEGEGKTQEPGVHEKGQEGRGEVIQAAQILNAQSKSMKQFLAETLPEMFREASGRSLDIVQTDDTISFTAPLSAYFDVGQSRLLKNNDLATILDDLVGASSSFTETVRIRIDSPNVVIGRDRRSGAYIRSGQRCLDRLYYLMQRISNIDRVDPDQILTEFRYLKGPVFPPGSAATEGWENRAVLTLAFTNSAQ